MVVSGIKAVCLGLILALPMGCADANGTKAELPPMRWDHRPEASIWTTKALAAIDDMPPSLNQLAKSFGWSRSRLRSAHDRWLIAAAHAGDPTVVPALPVRS